ncbi:MAG: hypothetical protein R3E98_03275 [Gemmatimonadota bacterium]
MRARPAGEARTVRGRGARRAPSGRHRRAARGLGVVLVALGALLPRPLAGQSGLEGMAAAVQRAVAAQDLDALRGRLSTAGVLVHVHGQSHAGLAPHQAVAALRDFFRAHEVGTFRPGRVVDSGGEPRRGFAEVEWDTVVRGTSEAVRYRLFTGFAFREDRWWVDELRVLPANGSSR